jgi:hypothetical protein
MALSYSWHVGALDTYPTASDSQDPVNTENDVVYNVHYTLTVSTGSESASIIGTQAVSTEDLSSFDSFDALDNAVVSAWITSEMESANSGSVQQLKNAVSASLNLQRNPTSVVKYLATPGE